MIEPVLEDSRKNKFRMPFSRLNHPVHVFSAGGKGLFAENMFPRLQGGDGRIGMGFMIRADGNRIDFPGAQKLFHIRADLPDTEAFRERLSLFPDCVAQSRDRHPGNALISGDMFRRDDSAADDSDMETFRRHFIFQVLSLNLLQFFCIREKNSRCGE